MNLTPPASAPRRRALAAASLLCCLVVGTPLAAAPAAAQDASLSSQITGSSIRPAQATVPDEAPGVPDGVAITRVDDVDGVNGHVKRLHIRSAAMPDGEWMWDGDLANTQRKEMLVELVLPRDWYEKPDATWPSLWGLNGLYGSEYSSAWLQNNRGDAQSIFGDKNIMLVLPVGGQASFYTDWQNEDRLDNLKWDTFLTEELPGLLARDWRTNNHRGAMGVSMGATASVLLAERHPDLFQFAGSMSGFLDMSSPGMPAAVDTMMDPYQRDAVNMWGPYYSSGWRQHDPKLMLGNLRNSTVFVSAGTGDPYPGEGYGDAEIDQTNQVVEALSRVSTQTFIAQATGAGVTVRTNLRPRGSHNWMSWQMDMRAAWPVIRDALGVTE